MRRRDGRATAHPAHECWADTVSLLDPRLSDWTRTAGQRRRTDAYLPALAVRRGGRLARPDRHIAPAIVRGAQPRHLAVLA